MSRITRGEFLGFGAALAGLSLTKAGIGGAAADARQPPSTGSRGEPDLIVHNARVYTVDETRPRAEAFAVANGRFVAVGTSRDVRNLASSRTRVIDAQRATITPGFIDTHCHVSGVNELYAVNANVRRLTELLANLRRSAGATPPGQWITAVMFDDTKLDVPLTRGHLDQVSNAHPIAVSHRGGHTTWYNSKAFELAGVTRGTPDPDHGRFFRDERGELTGRVAENARSVFGRVGTRERFTPEQQRERSRAGMRHMSELLTAAGLTSVHDAGAGSDRIQAAEDWDDQRCVRVARGTGEGLDHGRQARRLRDARKGPARRAAGRDQGHQDLADGRRRPDDVPEERALSRWRGRPPRSRSRHQPSRHRVARGADEWRESDQPLRSVSSAFTSARSFSRPAARLLRIRSSTAINRTGARP